MFGNEILDIVFAPWAAHALFAANRLKIFDLLSEKAMTVDELAAETTAKPQFLKALLFDPHRQIITVPLLSQWLGQAGYRDIEAFPLTVRSTCLSARK